MIENKDNKRSLLIPRWSSIHDSGIEDFNFDKSRVIINAETSLRELQKDFEYFIISPSVTQAASLLNDSIMLDCKDIACQVSSYLKGKEHLSSSLSGLLNSVLPSPDNVTPELSTNLQIADSKLSLRKYPRNPLLWVELARLYTIKGQIDKARKCIMYGQSLASSNRFISRACARFFVHIDEPDVACDLLTKAYSKNSDPMILATLCNCALLSNRRPPHISKTSIDLIRDDQLYYYSELLSTYAIMEMRSGKDSKAIKSFKRAWLNPTANAVAYAEWVIRNHYPGMRNTITVDYDRSSEAAAWRRYYDLKLREAVESATKWSLEEPYSTHPFIVGSNIACDAAFYAITYRDYKLCQADIRDTSLCNIAVNFAKKGLEANPNDVLLKNNLAYALLRIDRLDEARDMLNSIRVSFSCDEIPYLTATKGYQRFKCGDIETGRNMYLEAVGLYEKKKDKRLEAKAKLSHAIAEKEARTDKAKLFIEDAIKHSKSYSDPSMAILRNYLVQEVK